MCVKGYDMKIEIKDIVAVEFGGEVMMYGSESVYVEKQGDVFSVVHTGGPDGCEPDVKESTTDKGNYDKLLEALSKLEIAVENAEEEICDFVVSEQTDGDGASQWFLNVFYPEDKYVSFIGYDYTSDAFKSICSELKKSIPEFGKIKGFFDGLRGE